LQHFTGDDSAGASSQLAQFGERFFGVEGNGVFFGGEFTGGGGGAGEASGRRNRSAGAVPRIWSMIV